MTFNKNYLNHNLQFYLQHDKSYKFYLCNKCNIIINYVEFVKASSWYEEVYFNKITDRWYVAFKNDANIYTCEELLIKRLLE